jgi:hypothetical protein
MKITLLLMFTLGLFNIVLEPYPASLIIFKGETGKMVNTNKHLFHITVDLIEQGIVMTSYNNDIWDLRLGKVLEHNIKEQLTLIQMNSILEIKTIRPTVVQIYVQNAAVDNAKRMLSYYLEVTFENKLPLYTL